VTRRIVFHAAALSLVLAGPAVSQELLVVTDSETAAVTVVRRGELDWVSIGRVARLLGVEVKESAGVVRLKFADGDVQFSEGSATAVSKDVILPPLPEPSRTIRGRLYVTLESLPLIFPATLGFDRTLGKPVLREVRGKDSGSERAPGSVPIQSAGFHAYPELEGWGIPETAIVPTEIDLAGSLRGMATYDPDSRISTQRSSVFVHGEAAGAAVEAQVNTETSDGRTVLRESWAELDDGTLRIRAGDDFTGFAGFRHQTETRRGIIAGARLGRVEGEVQLSPAALNKEVPGGPEFPVSVTGGALGFRISTLKIRAAGYQVATAMDQGATVYSNRIGYVSAEAGLPLGNRLSAAVGRDRLTGTITGAVAWRTELRTENAWIRNTARYENVGTGFRSFGNPALYGEPYFAEVNPVLTVLDSIQPHGRFARSGTDELRQAGVMVYPASGVGVDVAVRRRTTSGQRADGIEVAATLEDGPDYYMHGRVTSDRFLRPVAGSPRNSVQALVEWGFPLGDRTVMRIRGETTAEAGITRDADRRVISPGFELDWMSWGGSLDFRLGATLDEARTGIGPVSRSARGVAGAGLHVGSFMIQPEGRLDKYDLEAPGARPVWSVLVRVSQDFPIRGIPREAGLTGVVFSDENGNGRRDVGEEPIPDVPVVLDGEIRTLTDGRGRFTFTGLAPVNHRLSVDPLSLPAEYAGSGRLIRMLRTRTEGGETVDIPLRRGQVSAPRPQSVVAPVPKTDSVDAVQAARIAVQKSSDLLDRLKGTGYRVMVEEEIREAEGLLADATDALGGGDAGTAQKLAGEITEKVEAARARIESETRQPLRW
jgi:hypothetical protein